MKFKKKELLLGVLLGAGLNLLNSLRENLPDNLDDIKTRVRDTYGTAADGCAEPVTHLAQKIHTCWAKLVLC
jgi:hypothetical protein